MIKNEDINYKTEVGIPIPLGVTKVNGGINFSVMIPGKEDTNCSVILYKKGTMEVVTEIVFTEEMRFGKVCAITIMGISLKEYDYNYRIGNKVMTDPYATIINGSAVFGEGDGMKKTSSMTNDRFDWQGDKRPQIQFSDSLIYRMHVRGFTMHRYSKVHKKGTFAGILEKIEYLKELGVTMIELMPAYEFNEKFKNKIDYWGYRDADYFMPKMAYSSRKDPKNACIEFKTMVRELHKNNIEVCMEFHFNKDITPSYMMDCFRHWVFNYHIDGIHCSMDDDIRGAISADPYLSKTKIISYGFDSDNFSSNKHLGEYNDVFMNIARRFLKGDEGQVNDMAFRIKYNKSCAAQINYIATNNSLTLKDMISYEKKHNENNGEYNKDGVDNNYSWNCGFEGETKRKSVVELRKRQAKNAIAMVMLSQGTPLIYAGDEFGNSCQGNNNPYCQDNDVSYLDWRLVDKNNEYFQFVKKLINFRKSYNILHMEKPMYGKDYYSLGMPDISFHSEKTWCLDYDVLRRHFGVMLYGRYCKMADKQEEDNIFIGLNMHWEEQEIGLPTPGKNCKWTLSLSTDETYKKNKFNRMLKIPPRSIVVLVSKKLEKKVEKDEETCHITIRKK